MALKLYSLVLAGAAAAFLTESALAQVTSEPDLSGISAGCLGLDAGVGICAGAAGAYAASVAALPSDDADQALIDAALLIADAVLAGECVEANPIPAAGLQELADAISDPSLAAQVLELTDVVASCTEIPVAAIGDPLVASPN